MSNISASMVKELREITGAGLMDCKRALVECNGDFEESKELLRKKGQAIANKKSSRETKEGSICIRESGSKTVMVKIACETDFVAKNDNFMKFMGNIAEQVAEVGADNFMEKSTASGSIKEQFVEIISKLGENIVFLTGIDWEETGNSVVGAYTHTNSKIGVIVEVEADQSVDKEKQKEIARNIAMHIAASQVEAIDEGDLKPEVIEKERKFLIDQAKESGKPDNIIEKMVEGRLKKFKKDICLLYQNYVKDPDKTIEQYVAASGTEIGAKLIVKRFCKEQF